MSDPSNIWAERYEAGGFDDDVTAAVTIQEYGVRIAALERLVGSGARILKGAPHSALRRKSAHIRRAAELGGISEADMRATQAGDVYG